MSLLIRPPKTNALIGTPAGFSQSGSIEGHCPAGAVKREFGCAAGRPQPGVQSLPVQSIAWAGGVSVIPSHHTSPSSVSAVLVKIAFFAQLAIAFGLDCTLVPGATPKNPASGLIARSTPCSSVLIHAMSSPTVVTFQPVSSGGGTSMARLVLPHALGNAAPSSLSELAVLRMNMSPTATGGFSCCAEPRSIERNLRFVRGLCLTPTGC